LGGGGGRCHVSLENCSLCMKKIETLFLAGTCDGARLILQESAIGKALWQQITTVVILRQHMR
jgi:hypothetical protein